MRPHATLHVHCRYRNAWVACRWQPFVNSAPRMRSREPWKRRSEGGGGVELWETIRGALPERRAKNVPPPPALPTRIIKGGGRFARALPPGIRETGTQPPAHPPARGGFWGGGIGVGGSFPPAWVHIAGTAQICLSAIANMPSPISWLKISF